MKIIGNTKSTLALLGLCLATTAGAAGLSAQQQPAEPAQAQQIGFGIPDWLDAQDIGNGLSMKTIVKFTDEVTASGTGVASRAICLHTVVTYGSGLLHQFNSLELRALTDATPVEHDAYGLDKNAVVDQRPPAPTHNYSISYTPKPGYTWGTIRGAVDVDILAVEI